MGSVGKYLNGAAKPLAFAGALMLGGGAIGYGLSKEPSENTENREAVKEMARQRIRAVIERRKNPVGPMALTTDNATLVRDCEKLLIALEEDWPPAKYKEMLKQEK